MLKVLKTKKVLGLVIGALVVVGLVSTVPKILYSQNLKGKGPGNVLLFTGFAYDILGKPKPQGTPVYATEVGRPSASIEGEVVDNNGKYVIYGYTYHLGRQYYLSYSPNATQGTGPVTAPDTVNIFPSQW